MQNEAHLLRVRDRVTRTGCSSCGFVSGMRGWVRVRVAPTSGDSTIPIHHFVKSPQLRCCAAPYRAPASDVLPTETRNPGKGDVPKVVRFRQTAHPQMIAK